MADTNYSGNQQIGGMTEDQMRYLMQQIYSQSDAARSAGKPKDISFQSALVGGPKSVASDGSVSSLPSVYSDKAPLGQLADAYQLKVPDKINNDTSGYGQMKDLASNGPNGFLAKQRSLNQMNTSSLLDQSNRMGKNSLINSISNMAQNGGVSGAARERALMGASRQQFANNMDVRRQGAMKDLDIQGQGMLKQFDMNNTLQNQANQQFNANVGQQQMQMDAQKYNIGNTLQEIGAQRGFDQGKYQTDMGSWAAQQSANAQARGSSGGGGCCFIFLEARYGNGTMDAVVRRFRDENMTVKNKRGYYKLSEVLVPVMRKSKLAKFLVRITMTDPLVAYGKAYYGTGSKIGKIFKPLVNFWLKTFDYLGGEHEFIRENGEVV